MCTNFASPPCHPIREFLPEKLSPPLVRTVGAGSGEVLSVFPRATVPRRCIEVSPEYDIFAPPLKNVHISDGTADKTHREEGRERSSEGKWEMRTLCHPVNNSRD